jgi:hypothetical protein
VRWTCAATVTVLAVEHCQAVAMFVDYGYMREHVDFVVPTVEEALALIADGAINKLDLLKQAGLSAEQAEAELDRLNGGR